VALGPVLVATMLCASCNTTPNIPSYWKGAQAFEGMLVLWLFYHIVLNLQTTCRPAIHKGEQHESTKGAIELKDMDGKDKQAIVTPGSTLRPKYQHLWHWTVISMDIITAVIAIVFLIATMDELSAGYAVVWIFSLQLWAVFDARLVVCHFVNITVVMQKEADQFAPYNWPWTKHKKHDEETGAVKAEPAKPEPKEEKKTEAVETKS